MNFHEIFKCYDENPVQLICYNKKKGNLCFLLIHFIEYFFLNLIIIINATKKKLKIFKFFDYIKLHFELSRKKIFPAQVSMKWQLFKLLNDIRQALDKTFFFENKNKHADYLRNEFASKWSLIIAQSVI